MRLGVAETEILRPRLLLTERKCGDNGRRFCVSPAV